jgi:hypothetical protein
MAFLLLPKSPEKVAGLHLYQVPFLAKFLVLIINHMFPLTFFSSGILNDAIQNSNSVFKKNISVKMRHGRGNVYRFVSHGINSASTFSILKWKNIPKCKSILVLENPFSNTPGILVYTFKPQQLSDALYNEIHLCLNVFGSWDSIQVWSSLLG